MKRKAGRPAPRVRKVKFTTTLTEQTIRYLRAMGTGNASQNIEALVEDEIRKHPIHLENLK